MRDKSLAIFTILSQMAVGMVWMIALFTDQAADDLNVASVIFISSALGLLAAFFHLGKPLRGWRALTNFRSSWLSREILFTALFSGASAILLVLQWIDNEQPLTLQKIYWILGLFGFASIYSMAKAYQLRTVPTWNSWLTLASFIITAWLLGILMLLALLPEILPWVGIWPLLLLVTQFGLTFLWIAKLSRGNSAARLSVNKMTRQYRVIFWLRIGFGILGLVFLGIFIFGRSGISIFSVIGVVFISELLGRVLFYAARVRVGV